MSYASARSTLTDTQAALSEVTQQIQSQLAGARPDLAFLFVSREHTREMPNLGEALKEAIGCGHLLGCTAEAVVCNAEEIEAAPVLTVWAAQLPGATIETFEVDFERTPDGWMCSGIPELPTEAEPSTTLFLLGDPYTCVTDTLLERLGEEFPGVPVIGGMASGGRQPGENRLYRDGARIVRGAVGAVLRGGPRVRSVVSQGCRPIGGSLIVTKAVQNVLLELGGRPALDRFQEIYGILPERDRELVHRGLHVGIAMNEYRERFERGDFLITNVMAADKDVGALAIGNLVRVGQTVQFHVRDHESADEDLRHLLEGFAEDRAQAALLFTCNGRGTRLFPGPHHDAQVVQELCGPVPLAGFFAQGELGPVGGRNYIHGFTASLAMFG